MDDRHEPLSVLAFSLDDGVVPIGAVKPGVTLEIVADEAASRSHRCAHEAAELAGIGRWQDGEPRGAGDEPARFDALARPDQLSTSPGRCAQPTPSA